MPISSNQKRAALRNECRQKLSQHIDQKLGIRIAPAQVRLQPRPEDPYMWSFPPSKSHLFKTSLSQGTTGLYEQICEELNRSIEAVPRPEKTDAVVQKKIRSPASIDDSFTSQIQRLTEENSNLKQELRIAREATRHEKECKEDLTMQLSESTSQAILWRSAAEEYLEGISRFMSGVNEAMQSFQAAKPDHSRLQAIQEACKGSALTGLVSNHRLPAFGLTVLTPKRMLRSNK